MNVIPVHNETPKGLQGFNSGTSLARGSVINLMTQIAVAALALVSLPFVVQHLGSARYGLLSLALVAFGSFNLLELGLGRTTTRFVSQTIAARDFDSTAAVIWTSLYIQTLMGLVSGCILFFGASVFVGWINVPVELRDQAFQVIDALAIASPIVMILSVLRGSLEGAQRFDLVSYQKTLVNASSYVVPLLVLGLTKNVAVMVVIMLIVRVCAIAFMGLMCLRLVPQLRRPRRLERNLLNELLKFSGWAAISNFVVPILMQIDRFMISSLVGVAALTYYAVPFEVINGLFIIPGSVSAVLFSAFSGVQSGDDQRIKDMYVRSTRYLLIILVPIVTLVAISAHDILLLWQGAEIASKSAFVLTVLTVGMLVNALSWVASNLILGLGKANWVAQIHLAQLPLHLGLCYLLIHFFGINGAAVAYLIRVTFEATCMFILSWRLKPVTRGVLRDPSLMKLVVMLAVYVLGIAAIRFFSPRFVTQLAVSAALSLVFVALVWRQILEPYDQQLILRLVKRT
jgi:O-antigen/teichoic acid export membrane protein